LIDSKDELHIVWQDAPTDPQAPDYSSDCDFYHAASLDGGTTWGSATWIDSSGFYCWGIDATVDQRDNIYVFASYGANRSQLPWQNYCLGSRDSGATWQVTAIGPGNQPFGIVDTDGTLHVAHLNDIGNMQSEIRYNRSFDQGRTFVGEEVLGLVLGQPFPVWLDIVSSQNGKLYVAYQDAASGNFEIHMLTSPNRGKTWLKPERLTYTPTPSLLPTLAFDPSGGLHMIWNEITGNSFSELYYKRAFVPASIK